MEPGEIPIEIDPASEEYELLIELTSLIEDIHRTGKNTEQERRCRRLKKRLEELGIRVEFFQPLPGEITFKIDRLN